MNTLQNTSRLRRSVVAASALGTAALLVFAAPVAAFAHDGINTAPTAGWDLYSVDQDQSFVVSEASLFANDSDPDGDAFWITVVGTGNHGVATWSAGQVQFTPTPGFSGWAQFGYEVTDEHGATAVAYVNIDVLPAPPAPVVPPVAVTETFEVEADQPFSVDAASGVLANDSGLPAGGFTIVTTFAAQHGTLVLDAQSGAVNYTPDMGFRGYDTFSYRVVPTDPAIPTGNEVQSYLHVAVAKPIGGDDSFTVVKGSKLTLAAPGVLANDSSSNGNPIRAVMLGGQWHGTNGGVHVDGGIDYQTATSYVGVDTFVYKIEQLDANGQVEAFSANVTVTINIVEPGALPDPIALADSYTVEKDTLFSLAAPGVTANDSGLVGPVKTTPVSPPSHGLLALFGDGTMTYQPVAGYVGSDSFEYRLDRVVGGNIVASSAPVTVTLTIVDSTPNLAPIAADDFYQVASSSTLTVNAPGVLDNDSDADGDAIKFHLLTSAAHGTFAYLNDGSFSYSPVAGFVGTDTVTYVAEELGGDELQSAAATIHFEVLGGVQLDSEGDQGSQLPTESPDSPTTPAALAQTGSENSWVVLLAFLLVYAGGMALRFGRKDDAITADEA